MNNKIFIIGIIMLMSIGIVHAAVIFHDDGVTDTYGNPIMIGDNPLDHGWTNDSAPAWGGDGYHGSYTTFFNDSIYINGSASSTLFTHLFNATNRLDVSLDMYFTRDYIQIDLTNINGEFIGLAASEYGGQIIDGRTGRWSPDSTDATINYTDPQVNTTYHIDMHIYPIDANTNQLEIYIDGTLVWNDSQTIKNFVALVTSSGDNAYIDNVVITDGLNTPNCSSNWSCSQWQDCTLNSWGTSPERTCLSAVDNNQCGETYTGDLSEFGTIGACGYQCMQHNYGSDYSTWGDCQVGDIQYCNGWYCSNLNCQPEPHVVLNRSCNYCSPSWVCTDFSPTCIGGSAGHYGTQACLAVNDTNNCGVPYAGDYSELGQVCCDPYGNQCYGYTGCQPDDTQVCVYGHSCCGWSCWTSQGWYPWLLPLTCDYCTPVWQCTNYGYCQLDDSRHCDSVTDLNDCTQPAPHVYGGDYSEFDRIPCDYCLENWTRLDPDTCDGVRSSYTIRYADTQNCALITPGNGTLPPQDNGTIVPCCVEHWVQHDSACNGKNYTINYTDSNQCNTSYQLPHDDMTIKNCTLESESPGHTRYLVDANGNVVGTVYNNQLVTGQTTKSPFLSLGGQGQAFDLWQWLKDLWKGWFG